MLLNPNNFFQFEFYLIVLNNLLDLGNLQEQVKKAFCYHKLFWPFTVGTNCSSDPKFLANYLPSASNFRSFSRSLEQFFLTVGQNNFGHKLLIVICTMLEDAHGIFLYSHKTSLQYLTKTCMSTRREDFKYVQEIWFPRWLFEGRPRRQKSVAGCHIGWIVCTILQVALKKSHRFIDSLHKGMLICRF